MSLDDRAKMAEALDRLEQERERRIDQKVAEGKGIYGPPLVAACAESVASVTKEPRRDGQGREIFPDPANGRIEIIITGVPRAERDPDFRLPEQPKATDNW